jgi:hypothetical protein
MFGPLPRLLGVAGLIACVAGFAGCGDGSGDDSEEVIAPEGAPYSYEVPRDFDTGSPSFPGDGPRYFTTVFPSGSSNEGYLGIYEVPSAAGQRNSPDRRILARFGKQTRSFYSGEGATVDAATEARLAGHPAVCWRIHHFDNRYEGILEAESCAVVARHKLVLLSCTWKPSSAATIHSGGDELRASLKVF